MKNNAKVLKKYRNMLIILSLVFTQALTGCSASSNNENSQIVCQQNNEEKEYLLQNTMLDGALVATVDGSPTILRLTESSSEGNTYQDIINGEYISEFAYRNLSRSIRHSDNIVIKGGLLEYMTEEEMKKLYNNEFTDDDYITLIYRVKEQLEEDVNSETSQNNYKGYAFYMV